MPGKRIRIVIFIILALAGTLVPTIGYCGIIETKIICQNIVEEPGKISLDIEINNAGNATAYNVIATIFLADLVQRFENLGDNPPGGQIFYSCQFQCTDFLPGKYIATIRVNFEEQSGRPHQAYHIFEIPYRLDMVSSCNSRLSLNLDHPVFNPKAFWQPEGKIRLLMKNVYKEAIKPYLTLYLPDGFYARKPDRFYELSPGEENRDIIPLIMDPLVMQDCTYHVVIWYEQNGIHYSHHIKGKIRVEERPVYFKWYLLIASTALIILFVVIYYRNRGK